MTYIFKNLNENATFEDFRIAHKNLFDWDFFGEADEEDIPSGKIADANNEWVRINREGNIEFWIDDNNDTVEEVEG